MNQGQRELKVRFWWPVKVSRHQNIRCTGKRAAHFISPKIGPWCTFIPSPRTGSGQWPGATCYPLVGCTKNGVGRYSCRAPAGPQIYNLAKSINAKGSCAPYTSIKKRFLLAHGIWLAVGEILLAAHLNLVR